MQSLVLRDLAGQPTKRFLVQASTLTLHPGPRRVAHHVVVVDRSGSMWNDIAAVRSVVEKVAVLEEYRDSELLFSVVSYSSMGDCTTHFARIPLSEVMKPGSAHVENIRSIRSTGLTCMSQALEAGLSLVRPGEPTVLTFHSDGYANDASPAEEKKKIETLLDAAKKQELDLAVDTVAYSDCSDFRLLLSISDKMGGRCVVARDSKVVYQTLLETQKRLAEGTAPPVTLDPAGHDYVLLVSRSASKVVLSEKGKDLVVRGLKPEDDAVVYRLKEQAQAQAQAQDADPQAYYALSAAFLARGQIRAAKEALCATRDQVFQMHWRALSRTDVEAFYADVVACLGDPVNRPTTKGYGVLASGPALVDLFSALAEHKEDVDVDLPLLSKGYRLRSVRKLPGARDEQGELVPPPVKFEAVDEGEWVKVSGIQLSNANATLNLRLVRRGRLLLQADVPASSDVVCRDGEVVSVAGVDLRGKLSVYRNYTVVSDGACHARSLRLRVRSKAAWRALEKLGAVAGAYDHTSPVVELNLADCPVVDFKKEVAVDGLSEAVRTMLQARMVSSILRALSGGTSSRFSSAQVQALESVCVTAALNVSTPTTVPYLDRKQALADGIIDVRVGTKVEIGLHDVLPSQVPSANEFLGRHFMVTKVENKDGELSRVEVKGPKFTDLCWPSVEVSKKPLSSRAKPAVTDGLFLPLFESLFSGGHGAWRSFCEAVGADMGDQLPRFLPGLSGKGVHQNARLYNEDDRAELVEALAEKVKRALEGVLANQIRPLVFWVGATGTLPEGAEAAPLSAEQAKARSAQLKVGKKLEDATFYFLPDGVLLAAVPEEKDFSTGKVVHEGEVDGEEE